MISARDLPATVALSDSREEYGSAEALPLLVVESERCRAVLALQGAQLLSFVPRGDADWLWLSPKVTFTPGAAIRGGIPLCLPWFGVNRRQPALPKHGWLRQRDWTLLAAEQRDNGDCLLRLGTSATAAEQRDFPWVYDVEVSFRLGAALHCELTVYNRSREVMPLSLAMHSYFAADLERAAVTGLAAGRFLDNTEGLAAGQLEGPQTFAGEIDRVFEGVGERQQLETGSGALTVAGQGCDTVIIWNPGAALASEIADIGEHYRDYVCLERGMAFADELGLAPGACHRAQLHIFR